MCVCYCPHTPLPLAKKASVKGYPITSLLLCMHISHSHGITHTVGPGQCTHTHADAHHFATPVEHGCQAEKEREMYSFTFHCARIEC